MRYAAIGVLALILAAVSAHATIYTDLISDGVTNRIPAVDDKDFARLKIEGQKNILLIFMEDMGIELPAYGDTTVPTPALDTLASQGVVFENAYCIQATCSPSRSSMFSGQYPHQTGQMGLAMEYGYYMKSGYTSFLSILKDAGYYTGFSYKIHVDPETDLQLGFDKQYDWARMVQQDGKDTKDYVQMRAYFEDFLSERPTHKPFFFLAQTHDSHEPFSRAPFNLAPTNAPYVTVTGGDVSPLGQFGDAMPFESNSWQAVQVAHYYNAIQRIDAFVGLLMQSLEAHGLADDTIVVFSSDHGPSFTRGKLSAHEFSLHVPLMIRWPGTAVPGTRNSELVSLLDLPATFVDIALQESPSTYEGESLKDFALKGRTDQPWRDAVFGEYVSHTTVDYWPMRSVRTDQYRLVENRLAGTPAGDFVVIGGRVQKEGIDTSDYFPGTQAPIGSNTRTTYDRVTNPPQYELYDMAADPYEHVNLAYEPAYHSVLTGLVARLDQWSLDTQDPFLNATWSNEFTTAQTNKQQEIRDYEAIHGTGSFWGTPIAEGDWTYFIEQLPVDP